MIILATIVLVIFHYWTRADVIGVRAAEGMWSPMTGPSVTLWWSHLGAAVLLGAVPLTWARLRERATWREIGLGRGRVGRGIAWVAVGVPLALLAGWFSAGSPEARAVYPLDPGLAPALGRFALHGLGLLVYYVAWELLFRGILLGVLTRHLGFAAANAVQTTMSVIAHFGRPFAETTAAIPAGLAFGGITRKTESIWPVVAIHWVVGMAQDWFIVSS